MGRGGVRGPSVTPNGHNCPETAELAYWDPFVDIRVVVHFRLRVVRFSLRFQDPTSRVRVLSVTTQNVLDRPIGRPVDRIGHH
jgi:hypothetical protein